jgi:hypothetical protein
MSSGDMWWARSVVKHPGIPVPGFSKRFVAEGVEFSGGVIAPTLPPYELAWQVEVRSDYFLDPPRMPAIGEPFISLPKMTFKGNLGLAGGGQIGDASCNISSRQLLRWGDDEVASSDTSWLVGWVRGENILYGKNVLAPQKRDYGAIFFNLDRTRTLTVTLVTTFAFRATLGGVIGFAPLVFGTPQWKIYSLD